MKIDICERCEEFAVTVIGLQQSMPSCEAGRVLGRQLIRSGTSIGANVHEAQAAESRADFIHKLAIALKEAREAGYWLRVIGKAKLAPADRIGTTQNEAGELTRILFAIIRKSKT